MVLEAAPNSGIDRSRASQLLASATTQRNQRSANQGLKADADASISEEPGAGKLHAGICAGAARVTGCPTAMTCYLVAEFMLATWI